MSYEEERRNHRIGQNTQMKWEWPLSMMKQHEGHSSAQGKRSSANGQHCKVDGKKRKGEEEVQC